MLAVMALTSIGGCRAATKKAAHVDPRLENVRLRLRLVGRQWRNCPYLSGVFFNPMSATRPSMHLQCNPNCRDRKHYSCSDRDSSGRLGFSPVFTPDSMRPGGESAARTIAMMPALTGLDSSPHRSTMNRRSGSTGPFSGSTAAPGAARPSAGRTGRRRGVARRRPHRWSDSQAIGRSHC